MIDLKPALGRYIVLVPASPDGHYGHAGQIVKVTEEGVSYRLLRGKSSSTIALTQRYAAICDTEDEVERLQMFSRMCETAIASLRDVHRKTAASFIEQEKDERDGSR